MLGLYRKFSGNVASVLRPKRIEFIGGVLYLNEKRELLCENKETTFILADDVYTYFADNEAIWYSKFEDLENGSDVVYRINVNNIFDCRKGIIDKDNCFLYIDDGYIYCENSCGDSSVICASESVDTLFSTFDVNRGLTFTEIERILGAECGYRKYTEDEFFKDISVLYSLVGMLIYEKDIVQYTSVTSAEIIAKVIKICCKMNKNVSLPLKDLIKKDVAS